MSGPRIQACKMCGAGNDFVLVRGTELESSVPSVAAWARAVCRRGLSIGADGVLLVDPAGPDRLRVRFLNPDGSEAFCGNGSRCAARWAHLESITGPRLTLETAWGDVPAQVDGTSVRLVLPGPRDLGALRLPLGRESICGRHILAGVPHFVVRVDSVDRAPLARWGPDLRRHPRLGDAGANIDLVEATGPDLRLRTWERGVEAETLACGSGALAAAFAVWLEGGPDRLRIVPASARELRVELAGHPPDARSVTLEGDALLLHRGVVEPEACLT